MLQVPVTLDDYHRWLGELYARCRELEKALAVANEQLAPPSASPTPAPSDSPTTPESPT